MVLGRIIRRRVFGSVFCKDNLYLHRKEAKIENINSLYLLNEDLTNDKKCNRDLLSAKSTCNEIWQQCSVGILQ